MLPNAAIPRILVVDDEPVLGRLISHMLSPEYEVVSVHSVDAALERLAGDRPFDAVLCDWWLRDQPGRVVLDHVQRRWPRLGSRFVFVSGAHPFDVDPQGAAASRLFLSKPFTMRELRDVVDQVLARPVALLSGAEAA